MTSDLERYAVFSKQNIQNEPEAQQPDSSTNELDQYSVFNAPQEKQAQQAPQENNFIKAMKAMSPVPTAIDIGVGVVQGLGKTASRLSRDYGKGRLPDLLSGGEETGLSKWIDEHLPQPTETAGKFASRAARIGSDPLNLAVAAFAPWAALAFTAAGATGGQLAEEAGFGETGQMVGEIAPAAGYGVFQLVKNAPRMYQAVSKWAGGFTKAEQAAFQQGKLFPKDMTKNSYNFWKTEVIPTMQEEFGQALQAEKQAAQTANDAERMAQLQQAENQFVEQQQAYQRFIQNQDTIENIMQARYGEISPQTIRNPTEMGEQLSTLLRTQATNENRNVVNPLYAASREANEGITEIQPQLANFLNDLVADLQRQGGPRLQGLSPHQRQLHNFATSTLEQIAMVEDGVITGYQPISNQTILDKATNLRQTMQHSFPEVNSRGIFNPTLNALDEAVESAAQLSGNAEAYTANVEARNARRIWGEKYENPYVQPFRELENQDYTKNAKRLMTDIDEYRAVRPVLEESQTGRQYSDALRRDLIESKLKKFETTGLTTDAQKELESLQSVLTQDEYASLRDALGPPRQAPKAPGEFKPPKPPALKESPSVKVLEQKLNRTPTEWRNTMKTPEGIEAVKEEVSNLKGGQNLWEKARDFEARSILQQGKISKGFSGKDLANTINDEKNYERLVALYDEQTISELHDLAVALGDKTLTAKLISNLPTKAIKHLGVNQILYIIGLL